MFFLGFRTLKGKIRKPYRMTQSHRIKVYVYFLSVWMSVCKVDIKFGTVVPRSQLPTVIAIIIKKISFFFLFSVPIHHLRCANRLAQFFICVISFKNAKNFLITALDIQQDKISFFCQVLPQCCLSHPPKYLKERGGQKSKYGLLRP